MKAICMGLICLLGILGLTACKKSDATKPAENPITSFMTSETAIQASTRASGPWELGLVFSVSTAGKLTQLGAKMPEPGTYRVIVWDFDSKQLLRQKTVEQTSPDKLTLDGIDALALTANKKYIVSVNSQSAGTNKKYGVASKANSSEFMPFTKGSVLVYNSCYSSVATATYPNAAMNIKSEYYGFPEFTFIPD